MSATTEHVINVMNDSDYRMCPTCHRLVVCNEDQGLVYDGWYMCQCGQEVEELQ